MDRKESYLSTLDQIHVQNLYFVPKYFGVAWTNDTFPATVLLAGLLKCTKPTVCSINTAFMVMVATV